MPRWTASLTATRVNGMLKCLRVYSFQLKRNLFKGYHCLDAKLRILCIGHSLLMGSTIASLGINSSRIWRKMQRMALTQRRTRSYGKAFGPYTSQTNKRTCYGVLVENLFQRSKIWSGEQFYKIPAVAVALYKQRIPCMLCGVARAWMRCGKVTGGTSVQGFILKISKGCAARFMKMGSLWTFSLFRCGAFGTKGTNSG